jgi:pimeloyl-ACP methyl ester carboxylesterase
MNSAWTNAAAKMLLAIPAAVLSMQPTPQTTVHTVTSRDGTRIAYDISGTGPAVMLLHGGGQTRRVWHDGGYVARLSSMFTVITVDLRGNGDSDKPVTKDAYAVEHFIDDLLAVADDAHVTQFSLWGFSYGANIGRYLAVRSDRVRSMIYIGIPFGPAADANFREIILSRLRDEKTSPVTAAWIGALLDYPAVEPGEMRSPTLWLVGTSNATAMESVRKYETALSGTRVQLTKLEGLTHPQELEQIDQTLPAALTFLRAIK